MEFEKFKQDVDKLKSLLDDPQEGLMSWHGCLNDRMADIVEQYYGVTPKQIQQIKDNK